MHDQFQNILNCFVIPISKYKCFNINHDINNSLGYIGTFHVKWDQKYTISDLNSLDFFQIQHTDTTLDTIMEEKLTTC